MIEDQEQPGYPPTQPVDTERPGPTGSKRFRVARFGLLPLQQTSRAPKSLAEVLFTVGRVALGHCAVVLPLWAAVVALQMVNGTYWNEFGGHPDEAGHYVTGLMVRDFLASGQWQDPLSFAKNHYLHYPKGALGHWPPVFYGIEAAWTLVAPPSRASMLLLMALLTALLAATLYQTLRQELTPLVAGAAALLLLAVPIIRVSSGMMMAEIPLALFDFWAVLCFGRYLDTERWSDAAAFGLCAALAILTKGSGLALALVPPIAILLTWRFHLLARPSLWCSAGIVMLLCAPWYWVTLNLARTTWSEASPTLEYTR